MGEGGPILEPDATHTAWSEAVKPVVRNGVMSTSRGDRGDSSPASPLHQPGRMQPYRALAYLALAGMAGIGLLIAVSRDFSLFNLLPPAGIVMLAGVGALAVRRLFAVSAATISAQRQLVDAGFQAADAIVILRGKNGKLIQANAIAERVSGFSARELGRSDIWRARFPGNDFDAEQRIEAAALETGQPVFREAAWIARNGDRRIIRWSNVAVRYDSDAPSLLLKIGLDITELRRHELSLLRNETYLRLAHRIAKLCHWHWQPDEPGDLIEPDRRKGRFVYSDEARDIFGYEPDDLPGYGDEFALMIIHPEERDGVFAQYKSFRSSRGDSYSIEYRAIHRSGRVLYIRETAEWILDDDGVAMQIVGTFQDVTELRGSERSLKLAQTELQRSLRMSGLCHWSWHLSLDSVDGLPGVYHSSGETADLLGLDPEDVELNDEDWHKQVVHPDDSVSSWEKYQGFIKGSDTHFVHEYRILSRHRGIRYVKSICEKTIDAHGRTVQIAGALQDITEQRQREMELVRAKNAAEVANRTKTEFLANMSHELRTPLNAIIGFSQVIHDQHFGDAPERYAAYAGDIYKSGKLLLQLIGDILDMSKLEAGKVELFEEIIDIRTVAEDCVRMMQSRADEGAVKIEQNWERGLPALFADGRAVAQVLLNVLSNAVKFSPPGRSVHLTGRIGDSGDLLVVIRDNGIGMSAEAMQSLFSAFHQADASISRRYGGTGLGLAITKRLMELHGGSIDLSSEPGQGTRVLLRFPHNRVRAPAPSGRIGRH